jgi:hypothetical protein
MRSSKRSNEHGNRRRIFFLLFLWKYRHTSWFHVFRTGRAGISLLGWFDQVPKRVPWFRLGKKETIPDRIHLFLLFLGFGEFFPGRITRIFVFAFGNLIARPIKPVRSRELLLFTLGKVEKEKQLTEKRAQVRSLAGTGVNPGCWEYL